MKTRNKEIVSSKLSKKEIGIINDRYIRGHDKWYRMFCGMSTNLYKYENQTIYIRFRNTETKFKSNHETALRFAESWQSNAKELNNAKNFKVMFYKAGGSTGAMLNTDLESPYFERNIIALVKQIKYSQKQKDKFVGTIRGTFNV